MTSCIPQPPWDGFYEVGTGPGSSEFHVRRPTQTSHDAQSVGRIRSHPLVPATIPIYGHLYDVSTGRLVEVPEATEAGAAD